MMFLIKNIVTLGYYTTFFLKVQTIPARDPNQCGGAKGYWSGQGDDDHDDDDDDDGDGEIHDDDDDMTRWMLTTGGR